MFGLSTWEILIILAVALIFVGPDQLPKVARTIGKSVRQVRGAMGKVDDEMRKVVREASAELDDDGRPVTRDDHHAPADRRSPGHGRTMDYPEPLPTEPPTADGHDEIDEIDDRHPDHPGPEHHARDLDQSAGVEPAPIPTSASSAMTANAKPSDRDWSQVGKAPVAGQVAQTARPPIAPPTPSVAAATNETVATNETTAPSRPEEPPTPATEPTNT
jgi:sec-independent protein translocase protein TatB